MSPVEGVMNLMRLKHEEMRGQCQGEEENLDYHLIVRNPRMKEQNVMNYEILILS